MNNIEEIITREKIIVIIRNIYGESLSSLVEALYNGGIRLFEITFVQNSDTSQKDVGTAIKTIKEMYGDDVKVGAGTVLNCEQVTCALNAGAEYIISPNTDPEVIGITKERGMVSIPGALTPTEIITAHDNGASFVKLFPSNVFGFPYIKSILGPITHIKFIATGGVNEKSLPEYLKLGFVGAGISGFLTDKKLIANREFDKLTERAESLVSIVKNWSPNE